MSEILMWKETPTAPYSLKTFFSCWVLLGFPPSGSGSSGAFTVDEELVEASFKFCCSWTRKKKKKRRAKGWKWVGHYEMGRWMENVSVRWPHTIKNNIDKRYKRQRGSGWDLWWFSICPQNLDNFHIHIPWTPLNLQNWQASRQGPDFWFNWCHRFFRLKHTKQRSSTN